MKKHAQIRPGIAMLEMVITIGVFAIISTFLLKMFMAANEIGQDATQLSKAMITSESALEYLKNCRTPEEGWEGLKMPEVAEEERTVRVAYFDTDWERSEAVSAYTLKIYESQSRQEYGTLFTYDLIMQAEGKGVESGPQELFSMSGKKYRRGWEGGADE